MAQDANALANTLKTEGIGKSIAERITESADLDKRSALLTARRKLSAARRAGLDLQYKPLSVGIGSGVSGLFGETIRRNLAGRVSASPRNQGFLMIVGGASVSALGRWVPFLGPLGAGQVAVGSYLLGLSFYDKDDKRDPVYTAMELTNYKADHPGKK